MSRIRQFACGEPGPYGAHCTEDPLHQWSCYDAGDDVSFNERDMRENDLEHGECGEEGCSAARDGGLRP